MRSPAPGRATGGPGRQDETHLPDLRHTFGSHLALSGIDPVAVQRQMGHARASITMDVYVHEFESARRRGQVSEHLISALGGLISVED